MNEMNDFDLNSILISTQIRLTFIWKSQIEIKFRNFSAKKITNL